MSCTIEGDIPHILPTGQKDDMVSRKTRTETKKHYSILSIAVCLFHCYNIRSTQFITFTASDLAVLHACTQVF